MRKVTLDDIKNIADYEKIRPSYRAYIIDLKQKRRVQVGDSISFVFENRETVIYQVQEMMRAERIVRQDKIQQEIDVYNELVPQENELSATMFIEIDDPERLRRTLPRLIGIETKACLKIGETHTIAGLHEKGRSSEETTSTVHYIKFPFTSQQVDAWLDDAPDIRLALDHPQYSAQASLNPLVRHSLRTDLRNRAEDR